MEHDKLATRLSLIIYKLNQGERLTIESLANEFGVSKRTIERDIARFSYFDIKKEGKEFFLDELAVGKLNFDDIKNFAIFSGIKSLFPSLTNQFLKDILNEKINRAYMVQNSGFEDIEEKQQLFENLSSAIIEEKTISFFYNDKKRVVNPYKLINTNGIWYLSALENNTIKTYTFSKIKSLKVSSDKFQVDKDILKEIEKSEINFLSKESKEVHLKIQNSGFEDIQEKQQLFENLSTAIIEEKTISFFYNDKKRVVNPYKLINTNGIWYLSALENNTIKTYTFSKIKSLKISSDKFIVDKNILKEIEKSEINFLSKELKEVHLKIQNSAKEYFLRKKVLSNMKIVDNTDEYFVVSTNISFDDEILNIVKQWIPYIEILKPIELQEKLEDVLKNYLENR